MATCKEQLATRWQHKEKQFEAMRDHSKPSLPDYPTWVVTTNVIIDPHHISEEEVEYDNGYKSNFLNGILRKLIMLIFLRLKLLYTKNLEVGASMFDKIGAGNFKYNTRSYVMKVCKLFMFRYQIALILRRGK